MIRKLFISFLVILFIVLLAALYYFKQNYDHQQYLKSLVEPEQIDNGIEYILKKYDIRGASVAVIDNYQLVWAKGYGITDAEDPGPVTKETIFDVGSISKPISAVAAMRILAKRNIPIDTPANDILRSWKIPDNQYTDSAKVTIRHLLSHRGGINLDGYMGYTINDTLPTLLQELNGMPPSHSPKIEVIKTPGKSFMYSGGGYYILQQLIEDVSGRSFEEAVQKTVFEIIEMRNSTFLQDSLENYYESVASAHYKGILIKIKRMRFGAVAAGGLKSTAEDLAKFLLEIQFSLREQSNKFLDQKQSEILLFPESNRYGLGFMLKGNFFGHGGANVGFLSTMVAHKEKGYGIVILTNSSRDNNLLWFVTDKSRREIIDLISRVYNWNNVPNF